MNEAVAQLRSQLQGRVLTTAESDDDYPRREQWLAHTVAALDEGVTGAYVGFLRDEGEERLHAAYSGATLERLRDMKTRYDPSNVFRRNQVIPPRSEAESGA